MLDTTIQDADIQLNICAGYLLSSSLRVTVDGQNKQTVECLVPTVSTVIPNTLSEECIVVQIFVYNRTISPLAALQVRSCIANTGENSLRGLHQISESVTGIIVWLHDLIL